MTIIGVRVSPMHRRMAENTAWNVRPGNTTIRINIYRKASWQIAGAAPIHFGSTLDSGTPMAMAPMPNINEPNTA